MLFCLLLAAVNSLDRAVVERGIAASAESPLLTRVYSYDHRVLGTPIAYDNNRFIVEIAHQGEAGTLLGTAITAEIADVDRDGTVTEFSYFRYWHGLQVLTTACLALGSISAVQVAVGVLAVAAGAVYCFLDFLTVPAAVLPLTVFCALLASGATRDVPARLLLLRFVAFTLAFMVGFVLTWAAKWALAAAVMGIDTVARSVVFSSRGWAAFFAIAICVGLRSALARRRPAV